MVCNFSKEQDYRQAKVILCEDKKETEPRFSYAGITFLEQADETVLAGLSGSFDYALLDLGCDKERYKDILLRCDRRFLLGALNQWREKAFVTTAIQLQALYSKGAVEFLAVFYSAEGKRSFEAALADHVQLLPYEPEPFLLHRESLRRMEAIFSQTD